MGNKQAKKQKKYGEFDVSLDKLAMEFQEQRKNSFLQGKKSQVEDMYHSVNHRAYLSNEHNQNGGEAMKRSFSTEKVMRILKSQKDLTRIRHDNPTIKKIREINKCQEAATFFLSAVNLTQINCSLVHTIPMSYNIPLCQERYKEATCNKKKSEASNFLRFIVKRGMNEIQALEEIDFEELKQISSIYRTNEIEDNDLSDYDIFQQHKIKFKHMSKIERNKNNKYTDISQIISSRRNLTNSYHLPLNTSTEQRSILQSNLKQVNSFQNYSQDDYFCSFTDSQRQDKQTNNQYLLSSNQLKLSHIVDNTNFIQESSQYNLLNDKIDTHHHNNHLHNNNNSNNNNYNKNNVNIKLSNQTNKNGIQKLGTKRSFQSKDKANYLKDDEAKLVKFNVDLEQNSPRHKKCSRIKESLLSTTKKQSYQDNNIYNIYGDNTHKSNGSFSDRNETYDHKQALRSNVDLSEPDIISIQNKSICSKHSVQIPFSMIKSDHLSSNYIQEITPTKAIQLRNYQTFGNHDHPKIFQPFQNTQQSQIISINNNMNGSKTFNNNEYKNNGINDFYNRLGNINNRNKNNDGLNNISNRQSHQNHVSNANGLNYFNNRSSFVDKEIITNNNNNNIDNDTLNVQNIVSRFQSNTSKELNLCNSQVEQRNYNCDRQKVSSYVNKSYLDYITPQKNNSSSQIDSIVDKKFNSICTQQAQQQNNNLLSLNQDEKLSKINNQQLNQSYLTSNLYPINQVNNEKLREINNSNQQETLYKQEISKEQEERVFFAPQSNIFTPIINKTQNLSSSQNNIFQKSSNNNFANNNSDNQNNTINNSSSSNFFNNNNQNNIIINSRSNNNNNFSNNNNYNDQNNSINISSNNNNNNFSNNKNNSQNNIINNSNIINNNSNYQNSIINNSKSSSNNNINNNSNYENNTTNYCNIINNNNNINNNNSNNYNTNKNINNNNMYNTQNQLNYSSYSQKESQQNGQQDSKPKQDDQQKKKIIQLNGKTHQKFVYNTQNIDYIQEPNDTQYQQDNKLLKEIKEVMDNNSDNTNISTVKIMNDNFTNLNDQMHISQSLQDAVNNQNIVIQQINLFKKNSAQPLLVQGQISKSDNEDQIHNNSLILSDTSQQQSPNITPVNLQNMQEIKKHDKLDTLQNIKSFSLSKLTIPDKITSQQSNINKIFQSRTEMNPNCKDSNNLDQSSSYIKIKQARGNRIQQGRHGQFSTQLNDKTQNKFSSVSVSPSNITEIIQKQRSYKFDDSFITKDYQEYIDEKVKLSSQSSHQIFIQVSKINFFINEIMIQFMFQIIINKIYQLEFGLKVLNQQLKKHSTSKDK